MVTNLRSTLQAITSAPFFKYRVGSITASYDGAHKYSNEDLAEMVDAFGKYLHYLRVYLGVDVSHFTLERLLGECGALRTLYLDDCAIFIDELVVQLADQCNHATDLSLAGAISITNMSMCYFTAAHGASPDELVH